MAKLMNKRDALKYIASVTSSKDREKVKAALKHLGEQLRKQFPTETIKPIEPRYAIRAYYQSIIDEAFKKTNILEEKRGVQKIRKGTLDKAIKRIQNTNYYSTDEERWRKTLLQGYEDLGYDKKNLRDLLGVTKIKSEYFNYVGIDEETGQEIVRYEDKMLYITFVRNDLGETVDIKLTAADLPGPYPQGKIRRRYAK